MALLTLLSLVSHAQSQSSKTTVTPVDSLAALQKKLAPNPVATKSDSISKKITDVSDSLKTLSASVLHYPDSLKPDFKKYKHGLDSTKKKLSHTIDSLKQLGLPHKQYDKALDSLNKLNPTKEFQKIQAGINKQQQKIAQKINEPIKNVNEKINAFSKGAEGKGLPEGAKLPNVRQANLPNSTLPNTLKTPGVGAPNLPATNLNQATQIKDPLSGEVSNLQKDISKDVPNVQKDLQKDLQDITPSKEIKEAQQASSDMNKDLTKYSKDVNDVQSGKYTDEKKIEQEITSQLPSKDVSELQKETKQLSQQGDMLKSLKNKEDYKKHTLERARKVAAEQLATQEKNMQPLIAKVNQYQKDADNLIKQTKGLPKQRPPRESVPPLIERFIPSFNWQVQKNNLWRIDFNPSVRFRVKRLISIGTGWNERLVIDEKGNFEWGYRVFGVRNFIEITFRKGVSARLDAEYMSTFVPVSFQQQDVGERKWVSSYLAGLKKSFSFGRGVTGNTQIMYLLSNQRESPYVSRLNVRFGIEFPLKVKRRPQN